MRARILLGFDALLRRSGRPAVPPRDRVPLTFHDDKPFLTDLRAAIVEEWDSVRLTLHERKSHVYQ